MMRRRLASVAALAIVLASSPGCAPGQSDGIDRPVAPDDVVIISARITPDGTAIEPIHGTVALDSICLGVEDDDGFTLAVWPDGARPFHDGSSVGVAFPNPGTIRLGQKLDPETTAGFKVPADDLAERLSGEQRNLLHDCDASGDILVVTALEGIMVAQ